jgi:hypothetical protein
LLLLASFLSATKLRMPCLAGTTVLVGLTAWSNLAGIKLAIQLLPIFAMNSLAGAVLIFDGPVRPTIAVVAVGLAVAAANGAIFARAEPGDFDATAGDVGSIAKSRLGVAP